MILYIDETENDHYFIVTGLMAPSKDDVDFAYKRFKKKISSMKINPKMKQKIFNEFKSVILDRKFQKIKIKMLNEIMLLDNQIIYSYYLKKNQQFNQLEKEKQYIQLLDRIVSSISVNVDVVFDSFHKIDFENRIIHYIGEKKHVCSIESRNSYDEPGIQFVDNLCSVIRLSFSDSKNNYFHIIKNKVIQV